MDFSSAVASGCDSVAAAAGASCAATCPPTRSADTSKKADLALRRHAFQSSVISPYPPLVRPSRPRESMHRMVHGRTNGSTAVSGTRRKQIPLFGGKRALLEQACALRRSYLGTLVVGRLVRARARDRADYFAGRIERHAATEREDAGHVALR